MVNVLELFLYVMIAFGAIWTGFLYIRFFDRKNFEKESKQEQEDKPSTEVYRFSKEDGFKIIRTKSAIIVDYAQANISEQAEPVKRNNIVTSHDSPPATSVINEEKT